MPQTAVPLGWRPQQLLQGLTRALPTEDCLIEHLALDAAECGPGTLFLAARGCAEDRLRDAARAAASGCLAVAFDPVLHTGDGNGLEHLFNGRGVRLFPVEHLESKTGVIAARFFGDPSSELNVIGVFGRRRAAEVGHLIAQALSDQRCGVIGELGTGFLDELQEDVGVARTDPLLLQERLARLRAAGARTVSAACLPKTLPLAIGDGLHLDTAVFAGDPGAGPDAPAQVAALRRAAAQPSLRWAVINRDLPMSASIDDALGRHVERACFSQSAKNPLVDCDCWVRATEIARTAHGLAAELETSAGSGSLEVSLLGRANLGNLLAVIGVLLTTGRDLRSALAVASRLQGVPGRLEPFTAPNSPLVVVDHADRPRTLLHAIRQLRGHRRGRLIVVFGCAGGAGRDKRAEMGAIAERHGDRVILTDDNPRAEDGDSIIEAILAGTNAPAQIVVERQRALAIRRAIALAGADDTVLIAGKGHETTQDMGELKVHFSDRAQVVQALSERRGSSL